jgi:hypothetical protein
MSFDSIKSVEEFYKSYAHKVGFSVYIGSQKLVIDEVMSKKFLCSRQGFKKTNVPPIGKQKNHPISLFRSIINAHKFCTLSLCNGNNGAMVPSGNNFCLEVLDHFMCVYYATLFLHKLWCT